ncbi:DUF2726 domain-containing protein [Cupriavidus metallidurans]|uniref:DUF2726 domain-containing protein n=1 Tax=Cupriavidus metallidurans TaxID=119219 RepID=A0A482J2R2_9BURK|nr:DUF2726 domain-containing protein [Cupriavidus metallidurans]QBP14426.1 DUF2726 domain-containing protein [Cupriavidus metallidurans]
MEISYTGLVVVCAILAVLVYLVVKRLQSGSKYSPKHYQTIPLLTEHEQDLFWRLKEAAGRDLIVAPQMVFGAFLKVKTMALVDKTKARHQVAHNRGDFIVCNKEFRVVAVIELDDATHDKSAQKALDRRRDQLLKTVGVKAIRYRKMPEVAKIRADLGL